MNILTVNIDLMLDEEEIKSKYMLKSGFLGVLLYSSLVTKFLINSPSK